MKNQILIFSFVMLAGCQIETKNQYPNIDFEKHVKVFKYDSTYTDSTLITELWIKNDSIINSSKRFNYNLPFESSFVRRSIIENLNGQKEVVTFDSLICEVGGASAWNKYFIEYDNNNKPIKVKHFKAWWYEGLGDLPQPEEPEYFLGEIVYYHYGNNWIEQKAYDAENKLIEIIKKKFDNSGRLTFEHWDAWNYYRYKAFYDYK